MTTTFHQGDDIRGNKTSLSRPHCLSKFTVSKLSNM